MLSLNTIHHVDALEGLRMLPDESIDCVMTSPPYWSLRDYGIPPSRWPNGSSCVLGLEPDYAQYVEHLCAVFDEIHRVLKSTGTLWVNLGDTYSGSWGNYVPRGKSGSTKTTKGHLAPNKRPPSSIPQQAPRKSLCMIPERFALEMLKHGWILRNRIVWHKPNHMPSSAKDRFTGSWEHLFFFVKSPRYYFDLDAVRLPHRSAHRFTTSDLQPRPSKSPGGRRLPPRSVDGGFHPRGKNPADFWTIGTGDVISISPHTTQRLKPSGAHFAVYPEALCERPILAGCPPEGTVLDPFMGSGTTAVVAARLGRKYIGFDLNPEYVKLAQERLADLTSRTHSHQLKGGGAQQPTDGKEKH